MKTKILLILGVWVGWNAQAQTQQNGVKAYSLQQCIEYALTNNTEVKNATLDEYIANSKVDEYVGTGLPQVTANAGVQHAKPLRAIYVQNNPGTPFYTSEAPPGKVLALPNFFQLPNTVDASVSLSQLLFSSSYFYGLKAAKTYRELARNQKEVTRIQVIENVTKAYYMALINQERKNLFDINLARVDSLLKQTRAMNKSGFAEKLDVDRLEVTYNNLLTEKKNFDNMLMLSALLLKYQMNMPINEDLALTDKLADVKIDSSQVNATADYSNRVEYRLLKSQARFNKLNYTGRKYSFLPSLSFTANVGYFTQSPDFNFSHGFSRYGVYGIGLNVPLFTGLVRLKQTQQAKLELQKTENNIEQFEKTVALQSSSAAINYNNSLQSLSAQKRNMELAKEVARVTKIKYTSGVGSNLEVVEAESSLKEAQINYYNALYDALVNKIEYDKALGNLK